MLGTYFIQLLRQGNPKDLSQKSGNITRAVCYSCIGAMSPTQKESAYLHLPTYMAGILFHVGIILSILVYILFPFFLIFQIPIECSTNFIAMIVATLVFIAALCGSGLFIKRLIKKELKELSCADDYISNLLCTMMLFLTTYSLLTLQFGIAYHVTMALLFMWIPFGKTKHVLYFFFARYHLGFFYGWRGTWPPKKAMQYDK